MKINKRNVGGGSRCYIIAEIGHNHQGIESNVFNLIRQAAKNGASAVKFQKRNNSDLFLPQFYNKSHKGKNSFGSTYGIHREYLEPKISWLSKANDLTHKLGLDFIMTVFDEASLKLCEKTLKVDAYKIQSADLTSHFLIKKVAAVNKPYFISCGAASLMEIEKSYLFCKSLKTPFCLMYSVSEYPTPDENVNLTRVTQLMNLLKSDLIGFSCHHTGIEPAVHARILGAVAIEKHFTLDKKQKGPDHRLSITPVELKTLKQRLDFNDTLSGIRWTNRKNIEAYQESSRFKMGKCAVAGKKLKKGHILTEADIEFKSPMLGLNYLEVKKIIGRPLCKNYRRMEVISD
jgi:sialic acid synthase